MIELRLPELIKSGDERTIYDDIYQEDGIDHFDSFYWWLLSLMKPQPGTRLLDISCGQGKLVRFARAKKIHAFGADFSEPALRIAQQRSRRSDYVVADAQALAIAPDQFDYVANIGSIEHYQDPAQGIREIARVLKPTGTACILLPNTYSLLGNVKHAAQTGDVYQGFQPIERYHTLNGWKRLLEENGLVPFEVIKFEMVRPRTVRDLAWYLARPPKVAHYLLMHVIPLALANCFVYLCRPRKTALG
jgi:SAM-dependent methyltransferase